MLMSIHQIIKKEREARGWSMQQLAEEIAKAEGLSKPLAWQTIQQWEKQDGSGTAPKRTRLEVLARIFGMSVAQLIGEDDAAPTSRAPAPFVDRSGIQMYHAPDAVIVPILANSGSMGPGNELLDGDVIVGDMALSPHWVNQYIKPQNPMELRFIHANGDSMYPTFTDGDVLLVDTGSGARDPSAREGVYVLQVDGRNFIKRVTPLLSGKLQVSSDNLSSKAVEVLNGDHEVTVVGRVVWAWNGKRL